MPSEVRYPSSESRSPNAEHCEAAAYYYIMSSISLQNFECIASLILSLHKHLVIYTISLSTMSTARFMTSSDRGDYEIDERWTFIDAYTMSNLHPVSRPNHASLAQTLKTCDEKGLPDIGCPSPQ